MIPDILPRPRHLQASVGGVILTSPVLCYADEGCSEVVATFAEDLDAAVGWALERSRDGTEADIRLRVDPDLAPEHYTLRVREHVEIAAADAAGFAYALTTLRQLGPPVLFARSRAHLSSWTVPGVDIEDGPAFAWRGVHLDVARHFFGVDTVVRLIDLLATHRLNTLHLHLNDDQGWRIEIPTWPRLTEVGATRSSSPVGHERDGRSDGVPHGGFFRAEDVAVILEHARRRHVRVVPEIDLPGHAQAVLAAYPQFATHDTPVDVWTRWGVSEQVLNVEPATLAFAEDVVRYVAGLFPGSPVHIGGDECPTTLWETSPPARAVMKSHGFERAAQLQVLYTERLAEALRDLGREVLAWDEVLDATVPDGTVICAWRSVQKGAEAIERGLDVVMAPMEYLYFDWLSSDAPDESVAVAQFPFVTTWEKVYAFRPVPDWFPPGATRHVRGAQAQLWTEYIVSERRLDYMAFPRLSAFSEVVWGTAGELGKFRTRLRAHLARLDAMGVAYRPLDATP